MIKLILLFLISFNLFAGTMPNNDYKVGDGSVTDDKGFTFDTGDGANNETLKIDDTRKLKFSGNSMQMGDGASVNDKELIIDPASGASLKWEGSDNYVEIRNTKFRIGNGTDVDTIYEFDIGLGANNPKIKWDTAKQKFRQSIAGTDKDLGTGGGAGGGENFNNGFTSDDNANAEDGITGWTASAGTFTVTATDPLEGDQSFTWIPAAQNDTLDSPVLDFDKDIFLGRSCQASIEYIGGDENLTLQVIDADNDVLGSQVLQAHSISAPESVFFICPASGATANDKDLRLRLLNEGATASVLIKFDKSYVGTNFGLSESSLPDVSVAEIIGSSGAIRSDESGMLSGNCTKNSTGNYTCNFTSGFFTVTPVIHVKSQTTNRSCANTINVDDENSTDIICSSVQGSGALADADFSITATKKGVDAKQKVQVYKSIPKVSENINVFTAKISDTGAVSDENVEFITGSCSVSSSVYTCAVPSGIFSSTPNCVATPRSRGFNVGYEHTTSTATSLEFATNDNDSGVSIDADFTISCHKASDDFKMPTVQPVIVGQVRNSYAESASKNVGVESCSIINSGTPSVGSSNLCNSWIDSLVDSGDGRVDLNVKSGVFKSGGEVNCTVTTYGAAYIAALTLGASSSTLIETEIRNNAGTLVDRNFWVVCVGEK